MPYGIGSSQCLEISKSIWKQTMWVLKDLNLHLSRRSIKSYIFTIFTITSSCPVLRRNVYDKRPTLWVACLQDVKRNTVKGIIVNSNNSTEEANILTAPFLICTTENNHIDFQSHSAGLELSTIWKWLVSSNSYDHELKVNN